MIVMKSILCAIIFTVCIGSINAATMPQGETSHQSDSVVLVRECPNDSAIVRGVSSAEVETMISASERRIKSHIERQLKGTSDDVVATNASLLDSIFVLDSILLVRAENATQVLVNSSEERLKGLVQAQNEVNLAWQISTVVLFVVLLSVILYLAKARRVVNDNEDKQQQFLSALDEIRQAIEHSCNDMAATMVKNNDNVGDNNDTIVQLLKDMNDRLQLLSLQDGSNEAKEVPSQYVVAYDDAVQAFVNINNYIYDLKAHNSRIVKLLEFFSTDVDRADVKTLVNFDGLSDEERSKLSLLVAKVEQFKRNNLPSINRYLKYACVGKTYADCVRCPIGRGFDNELDANLLGDDMVDGDIVSTVYKLGFLFPGSKSYPYREKSLVL